jgi:hypothetical protein
VGTGNGAAPSGVPEITDPDVKKACFNINAGAQETAPGGSKGDAIATPPSPCAKGAKPSSAGSGKDVECGGQKAPPEPDKNFYGNLSNGMGIGLFGLLIGSLFGGPLIMAAVAITAGVGAYYLSKSINNPPDKKK